MPNTKGNYFIVARGLDNILLWTRKEYVAPNTANETPAHTAE